MRSKQDLGARAGSRRGHCGRGHTSTPIRLNHQYAERLRDAWVVLSAKYGSIRSDFRILGPCKFRLKHPIQDLATTDRLHK